MEIDFKKLMPSKSEDDLQEYINNRLKYTPDAVFAAIEELKKRGKIFTEAAIEIIKYDIEKHQEVSKQRIVEGEFNFNRWKKNVTDDINAPEFYSERVIYTFSILFSVLFGSILMAINLRNTETKKGIIEIMLFGIGYMSIQIWILSFLPRNSGLTLITSAGGAMIINYIFWKKY